MTTEYLNNRTFESIIAKFQQSKQNKVMYELILDDLLKSKERRKKDFENILLPRKEKEYNTVKDEYHESQNQLANAFYTLSENIVRYAKFHLIDEQDAVQEGVMICFEKIDRFDPAKGKAFNYMTTCILNNFRQLYRTARNYNELKRKYLEHIESKVESSLKISEK